MDNGIARALKDLRPYIAGALKDLRRNWGGAYKITGAPGVWRAMRMDNQATLIAIGPGELRDLITADYTARPVPVPVRAGRALPSMPAAPQPHPLMTPAEVADVFQVNPRTVWQWERRGAFQVRLPAVSAGTSTGRLRGAPAEQVRASGAGADRRPVYGPPGVASRPSGR